MWSVEGGGSVYSKTRRVSSRQHRATEVRKLRFLPSCQYTHGCCAPASWAARHTTVCLDFFLFSHTYKNRYKTRTPHPIALKFGTQKGSIKAHLGTNFGWNTINRQRIMSDYSRKITPICCHVYGVNRVWEEAENRWVNRLTIEPQTFCGLKEIELKTRKIQRKHQQCVTITQSRLANKKRLLVTPTR